MATKEIQVKGSYQITSPSQMVQMAQVLKTHIVKHNLYVPIVGKNYVLVEGWQFAGGLVGLFPRIANIENLSTGQEKKWKAEVEIVDVKTNTVVSKGFAVCSNAENKKKTFDEYAVLSMAQTRAIGKGYRNLIGWVMKLAGYEATPGEEMFKMGEEVVPPRQPEKGKANPETVQVSEVCDECKREGEDTKITKQVADYSRKIYGRGLCIKHQKLEKKNHAK